jgi:hypothetical protein
MAPTVVAADANVSGAQAVLSEVIANNAAGIAYTCGVVTGLNTAGAPAVGSAAYLSETTGEFAWSAPSDPGDIVQVIGYCTVKDASAGAILFYFSAAGGGSVEGAYVKPVGGIPSTDLTAAIQQILTEHGQIMRLFDNTQTLRVVATPDTAGSDIADVNAAEAGAYKVEVLLQLLDGDDEVQTWYNGTADLTPSETVTDADVGAPVVTGGNTVTFVNGEVTVELTYDTDAGATKTYAAADKVGFTTAIDDVLGIISPGVDEAVFTDTFIDGA